MAITINGLVFTQNSDGTRTYTVSWDGNQAITDVDLNSFISHIGGTLTRIGSFQNCATLTSIIIPDTVTTIEAGAFNGCSSLKSITIPFVGGSSSATSASNSTLFGYIFGTSSYTGGVPTAQYIGASATPITYYIPQTLKKVTITGDTIAASSVASFSECFTIEEVVFADGVTTIPDAIFWSKDTDEDLPEEQQVFIGNRSLKKVVISNTVTSIGTNAFNNCYALEEVIIGANVQTIGNRAFENCGGDSANGLSSITIPASVTSIGASAFDACHNLKTVRVLPKTPPTLGSFVFRDTNANLKFYLLPEAVEAYSGAENWNAYVDKFANDDLQNYFTWNAISTKKYVERKTENLQDKITPQNPLSADLIIDANVNKVFTAIEQTKLAGIENGAQVNTVDSVNGKTGAVVLNADDISDTNTDKKFVTETEKSTWNNKQNALTFDSTPTAGSNNPVTSQGIKSAIDNAISSVYKYKGSVATYSDLPNTGLTVGDVYNVESTGDNYAWTGSDWDKLSGTVDLSGYVPTSRTVNNKALTTDIEITADDISDTNTTNKFVTAAEKEKLSGIEDGAQVNTVDSVNGKTGAVSITYNELSDIPVINITLAESETLDLNQLYQYGTTGLFKCTGTKEHFLNLPSNFPLTAYATSTFYIEMERWIDGEIVQTIDFGGIFYTRHTNNVGQSWNGWVAYNLQNMENRISDRVPTSRKVNDKALTTDIEITADDISDTNTTNKFVTAAEKTTWNAKQNAIQFDTIPTATADNLGAIIQYTGTTNSTYINGHFYKCSAQGTDYETYVWEELDLSKSASELLDQLFDVSEVEEI